jgi:hypothetical protein
MSPSRSHRLALGLGSAAIAILLSSTGCSGSTDEGGAQSDAAAVDDGPAVLGDGGGTTDSGTGSDTSTPGDGGKADTGPTGDGGGLGFLQMCTTLGKPGDCAAGLECKAFSGKGKNYCTRACTTATAATDCPAPSKGCGGNGFCAAP